MDVHTYVSTTSDGSMKSLDQNFASVLDTRTAFLSNNQIAIDDTTLVHLTYDGDDYCRYKTIDETYKGDGTTRPPSIQVDGLVTTTPGHALFLPLADCIGAVIHDPTQNILMLSHLGRHNIEQFGGTKSIEYLVQNHHVDPKNVTVWLSPAAGNSTYPLFAFENRSLHEVATDQLVRAGVLPSNITASPIDTATDEQLFSHSQFLKGKRDSDGRFAVVTVMR